MRKSQNKSHLLRNTRDEYLNAKYSINLLKFNFHWYIFSINNSINNNQE